MEYIQPLENLIEQFRRLPGIGHKTAVRLAFGVLEFSDEEAQEFTNALLHAKRNIKQCSCCFNISEGDLCPVCLDDSRDRGLICVVEDAKAVMALEKVKDFKGVYHVLHGTISPMNGRGPDQLKIRELVARVDEMGDLVKEVIIATNPTPDGESTALYISRLLQQKGVKTSRLAYGMPVGGDLEYADEVTLFRALEGRREL